jgi:NTP pyrophosphatase (non-canonical NTP hydrolase)
MNDNNTEILLILQEECAEVIQAVSKILRFGMESRHPTTNINNKDHLTEEIGDLMAMLKLVVDSHMVSEDECLDAANNKLEKLKKWSNINVK